MLSSSSQPESHIDIRAVTRRPERADALPLGPGSGKEQMGSTTETAPATRLGAEMRAQGISMTGLAHKVGMSFTYTRTVTLGHQPGSERFRKAASKVLGVPVDELFGDR